MKIILRYIFRSMWERRLRTVLIVSAIMISSAMFFASISISDTLVKIQMDVFKQSYGYTDIIIQSSSDSPAPWFYINRAEKYSAEMEYIIGSISGNGTYIAKSTDKDRESGKAGKNELINKAGVAQKYGTILRGIDIDELQKLTPFVMEAEKNLYPFKGMKAVISSGTAEKHGLQCGDDMIMEINGAKYRFIVCGILRQSSVFEETGECFGTILPLNTLNSLCNARGRVDMVYLKLRQPAKKQRLLYLLSGDYSRYTVREPFTEWEIKRQTDRIATPVIIVTVILSFMCIYIIHSTFKIIVLERLPVIGTFRSIGAGKCTTNLILLMESLAYGIAGGISGCGFGTGLLYLIAALPGNAMSVGINVQIRVIPLRLLATLGIAVLLAAAGSLISIVKTGRISIKDIILGTAGKAGPSSIVHTVLGGALLCLSFLLPLVIPSKAALLADTACMITALLGGSLFIPFLTERVLGMLELCRTLPHSNLLLLAVRMLRKNRNATSGISMLMIGISSLYMISTLNWSQIRDTAVLFDRNLYDLTMTIPCADKTTLKLISETEGVKGVLGNNYRGRTEIEGFDEPIWHIQGIDTSQFPSYQILLHNSVEKGLLETLDEGRNILLTNTLKLRLGVKTDDSLLLKFPAGNGGFVRRSYKISGFIDTIIKGKWSYALISDKYFRMDVRSRFYGPVYIKTGKNPAEVANSLKAAFSKRHPVIELKEDVKKADQQSSSQLFFMLQGFTVLTLITGTFGILNTLFIAYLQRKRQLAMLRSAGMSRLQLRHMILAEAAIQGIYGSALGIAAGLGTTWIIVPQIILAMNIESPVYFSPVITVVCFITGVLAYMLASAGIVFKASNLDIIPEIKHE